MSQENEPKQIPEIEVLVSAIKSCIDAEPSEASLTELGEHLVAVVKSALAGEASL